MENFKKCLVIGAGMSGEWAARLLLSLGAEVSLSDQKTLELLPGVRERLKDLPIRWFLGPDVEKAYNGQDLIVLSPGVPWSYPGLREAMKKIPVTGEMELAAGQLKIPIAAVTGANGKTTTTSLLGHICRQCQMPVFVGGNIGEPLSKFILSGAEAKAVVLEASSYQLETVKNFHAKAVAILNISPDHLDRYADMAEYFRTKTNILINQTNDDLAVMNEDDILLAHKNTNAKRFGFSRKKAPRFGAFLKKDEIVVNIDGRAVGRRAWADFKLTGAHNQENVMAAVGLALGLGLDPQKALDAAINFLPAKHRLELVGEFQGIKYYDDSKGTNIGAVARALESFQNPVVLIAGGQGKGQNFSLLFNQVKKKVHKLVLMGEDKSLISEALAGAAPISMAADMAEAVNEARKAAPKGGVVLLSPACASFDMFHDYQQRGEAFAQEVKRQNK